MTNKIVTGILDAMEGVVDVLQGTEYISDGQKELLMAELNELVTELVNKEMVKCN